MRNTRLLGTTAVLAVVAGALISGLAFVVARNGPAGDGWSFKGNGALAVYTLIPVVLTAGWSALVLRARSVSSWLGLALGAGLVSLLIALLDALLIPLFGTGADATLGAVLLIGLVAWMVVAPALATRIPAAGSAFVSVGSNLAAGVVWLVAVLVSLIAVGYLIPAGS
jgi:hypothetical protein